MFEIIEVVGTITAIYSNNIDDFGFVVHKILIDNTVAMNTNFPVGPRILVIIRIANISDTIDFTIGSPITVKGTFCRGNAYQLDTIHTVHAPTGFIRYKGKIYQ